MAPTALFASTLYPPKPTPEVSLMACPGPPCREVVRDLPLASELQPPSPKGRVAKGVRDGKGFGGWEGIWGFRVQY